MSNRKDISQSPAPAEGASAFPQTRWSIILDAQDEDPAALMEFCRVYWFPLYSYARRMGRSVEDAQDLTQAFFERVLSRPFLGQARSERGRLRSFLLRCFNNFATEEWRRNTAQRRGAGQALLAIDSLSAEERFALEPHDTLTPEIEYGRAWARELLRQAAVRLGSVYESAGNGRIFEALRDQLAEGSLERSYNELAAALGMTEAAARFAAYTLRQRYRAVLREIVADTVADAREVEDELAHMRALFQH